MNFARNEKGLIDGVDYKFNSDGSVNWRAMIDNSHLYVNRSWFEHRNMEIPESVEGLEDNQLAIKLSGIKELAKLRGFTSVTRDLRHVSPQHVVASCKIIWMPNFETNHEACIYEDFASATPENSDGFAINFLETIACNRAFIRSVRNFLNIHIVGVDEFAQKHSNNNVNAPSEAMEPSVVTLKPIEMLQRILNQQSIDSFEKFTDLRRILWAENLYRNQESSDWKGFDDIPAKECLKLVAILKKRG